jgi:cell fate (sporulation/competence/biofilm development) regulator YlbF (YheA/YmcA/DUF963 family)
MEDIIADARALGNKIAAHPRTMSFVAAARAVSESKDAQAILKAYQEQVTRLQAAEQAGKPIEVSDKHALAESEARVAGNDLLKKMMKCQADYLEMMKRINDAIDEASAASQSK